MEYFESEVPKGRAACRDEDCPCYGQTSMAAGEGFLIITKKNLEFRRDCRTVGQLNAKVEAIERQSRQKGHLIVLLDVSAGYPVLACEVAAKRRNIDRAIAQEDARRWWQSGQVPFRLTPAARTPTAPGQPAGVFLAPDVDPSGDHRVQGVAVSADGRRAIAVGWDRVVRLWDLETKSLLKQFVGHLGFVTSAAFLGDGRRIVSAGADRTLRVWDCDSGRQVYSLKKHSFTVHALAVSADGKVALSISGDGTARLWDLERGRHVRTLGESFWGKLGDDVLVDRIAMSADGTRGLTAGRNLQLWDLATGKLIQRFPFAAMAAAFLPDGKTAIVDCGRAINAVDLAGQNPAREIISGTYDAHKHMTVSRNGRWLCFHGSEGTAQIVDLATYGGSTGNWALSIRWRSPLRGDASLPAATIAPLALGNFDVAGRAADAGMS